MINREIGVFLLDATKVLPREAKRALELIYPSAEALTCMGDQNATMSTRLGCFHIYVYGHETPKIVLNTMTAIERSMLFYLYFALNRSFR